MLIQQTFKYALKPIKLQKELFAKSAGSARFVFNFALARIKEAFESKSKIPTYQDLAMLLPKMKRAEETAWLKETHSQVLQQVLKDLESGMQHFWRRVRSKKGVPGFPRFKKKGFNDSFRYPQGVRLTESHIFLPKIGWVRYRNSRKAQGSIKQVTVKREGDRWFVCISCESERVVPLVIPSEDKAVGIDLGLTNFAYLSTGQAIANPRWLKKDLTKLKKMQQQLSRKKRGSSNRKKAIRVVAKLHTRIKNKRKDFHHKQSTTLVKNHDVVAVEDLNISGMIKNRRLSRSIADAGWNNFLALLKYKCSWQGKYFVEIERFAPTSKACSSCNSLQAMPLHVREYNCSSCGMNKDRDWNASINIRSAGLAVLNACGGIGISLPCEAGITGF